MISVNVPGLAIYETNGGNAAHREKMLALYAEFFPEYSYYLPYMAYRMELPIDADPHFVERWWLVEVDNQPVALRLFKYSPQRNCALVLGTAVKPEFRKFAADGYARLATFIINHSAKQVKADAQAAHRPIPAGLVSEVQLPDDTMSTSEAESHQHIIDRYRELGYIELPVDYYEPPHIMGRESFLQDITYDQLPFHHMVLSIFPIEGGKFDIQNRQMITDFTLAYLTNHYRLPDDHWTVRGALESIERHYGNSSND